MELKRVAILLLLVLISAWPVSGKVIYVDDDATGANDGTSWENAYVYLQDALADANSAEKPVEIRVAQGVYKPDQGKNQTPGDREATFQLVNGVALKGGYAGFGKADPNARGFGRDETVLSGDLKGNDVEVRDPRDLANELTRSDNSYHIINAGELAPDAVLDGLTITSANANGPSYPDDSGGGMLCNSNTTLLNCTFTSNFAVASGGGMRNFEASVSLMNCAFLHNSAHFGGGVYNQSRRLEPIPRGNLAQSGDGIHSQDTGPEVTIADCTFAHNSAEGGGGMYNVGPVRRMTNCVFIDNWGGGMSNIRDNPILIDCAFHRNLGSGMYNRSSSPVLTNCTFRDNSGGGMYNDIDSNPTLTNCTFDGNFALCGGGMSNWKSYPTLVNCTFNRNRAIGDTNIIAEGGAVYNYVSWPLLSNCILTGNSADQGGGVSNWGGSPTLTNCILSGNLATNYGGAMCNYEATGKLLNCTFCNNRASDGAGVYNNIGPSPRRELVITNCILWDGRTGIFNTDGSEITVTYSSVQGGWPGEGNIDTDPCFADPGYWDPNNTPDDRNDDFWVGGDYHLRSHAGRWDPKAQSWVKDDVTSPCINAGDPMSPIGHEPFPNGGVINMGAYGGTGEASKSYFGEPVCETIVASDINGDCKVDFADFAIMALHWLEDNSF